MFATKTRRDVGMVPRVSEETMCLHGKSNWWKTMPNNPGEHSAASYFKDTLNMSPSLHLATSVAEYRDRLDVQLLSASTRS